MKAKIPSSHQRRQLDAVRRASGAGPSRAPARTPTVITRPSTCSQNWPMTWPLMIDSRLIGIERKRSMTPSVMSAGGRRAGADHAEGQRLADDPGEQVVLVADPGHVDRRAEHVQEQQDEDDRLDRHVEQPLGHARDRAQAAAGQQQRCRARTPAGPAASVAGLAAIAVMPRPPRVRVQASRP